MDLIKYTWANIMVEVSPGVFRAIDRRDKAHIDTIPGGLEEWTAKVLRQKAFHRWVKQGKILSFHVETELYEVGEFCKYIEQEGRDTHETR